MQPMPFMTPNTVPECLGARSCGLGTVPELWNPFENRHRLISDSAAGKPLVYPASQYVNKPELS